MAVSIVCESVKRIKDWDSPKEDFGMGTKKEAKEAWLVKFKVDLSAKKIRPALTYETESEARAWREGKAYSPIEWAQLAFG